MRVHGFLRFVLDSSAVVAEPFTVGVYDQFSRDHGIMTSLMPASVTSVAEDDGIPEWSVAS